MPDFSFISHITLALMEVLLHQRSAMLMMEKTLGKKALVRKQKFLLSVHLHEIHVTFSNLGHFPPVPMQLIHSCSFVVHVVT